MKIKQVAMEKDVWTELMHTKTEGEFKSISDTLRAILKIVKEKDINVIKDIKEKPKGTEIDYNQEVKTDEEWLEKDIKR